MDEQQKERTQADPEAGFTLIGAIVMVFLMLLVLSIAAPRIAKQIQRDREQESQRRAQQYVRAIRVYYQKFKHYPGSVEQLEKSNNQRFLRQKYLDPLTGKDDWRLIHVGENKTKVKGFFGEDLPGIGGGLGAAAGMASSTGAQTTGTSTTSTFGTPASPPANSGSSSGTGTGTSGTGISSQNATDATGSGGPIMGVGSSATGDAMLVVNEQTTYGDWEFLYDPRIEQLYAKSTLLGGISSGTGGTGGFGTPIGGTNAPTGTTPPATTTPPTTTTPQ